MSNVEVLEKFWELDRTLAEIGWSSSYQGDYIVLTPNFGMMHAYKSRSVVDCITWLKGYNTAIKCVKSGQVTP